MAWVKGNKAHTSKPERDRILARDDYRCQIKGVGCLGEASEVDHIDNTRNANYWRDSNKQAVCPVCHKVKTQREATEARAARRARGLYPVEKHPGLVA
ncbi:HNH endonuclease [Corynebacterium callunae]|uniref:HNH endonuclease n=1 Tax=Corynebacterium callunae TaxID=1721 RepID=UPI002000417C|nr:HNH endonuclease signature motif containing protein [Corynebacterium callunae]MCK2200193.1 HNH endonuclease [Corynebacterium callunae]